MGYIGSDIFQQKNKLKVITYCWRVQSVALTEEQASLQQTENRLNMHETELKLRRPTVPVSQDCPGFNTESPMFPETLQFWVNQDSWLPQLQHLAAIL